MRPRATHLVGARLVASWSAFGLQLVDGTPRVEETAVRTLRELAWKPATEEQVREVSRGLRRLEDPFAAAILQEVARYRGPRTDSPQSAPTGPCEDLIFAALLAGPAERAAALVAFDALRANTSPDHPTFQEMKFRLESADGTTLLTGGPEGSPDRLAILASESFQLAIDDRNAQLNWLLPDVLYVPVALDRVAWPLPITAEACANYQLLYEWAIAPLTEKDAALVRLTRTDVTGLELYLRVHGRDCSIPQGALLVRDGVLQKAGFLGWGNGEAQSAVIVPRTYLGFLRNKDTTTLERWTIRDVSTEFRPTEIRLEVPASCILWDMRTQEHRRFGSDRSTWPSDVRDRVRETESDR